ncbi:MAG: hypothetical protein KKH29_01375 [Candidatus Omnitrophica bacterium]|nr:hypothetical protein [Candidatus Omnitrophota bacterium]MBU4345962.1 hypothetical protein [Candidatus Omnitrophota bacterium]MBU4472708.1 hypothetical protein [Candidatus Omnitrophota bacterium]MCG2705990.1 hypothetical protein [Candidatus Omnitrophota bacterium]
MQNIIERLIKAAYKKWRSEHSKIVGAHPDEETFALFVEGKLPPEENSGVIAHLITCDNCAQILAVQARLKLEEKEIPQELVERMKGLVIHKDKLPILEIALRLKEKALEILNTTGDVLLGQELIPAPVLRSRNIKDFKDEVTILKDFKDIRTQIKIENQRGQAFTLTVMIKEKETQKVLKDLRITLLKDDLELESYHTDSGSVSFEHALLGRYTIEIFSAQDKLASVLLDIKT